MSYLGDKFIAVGEWVREARQCRLIRAQMHSDRFPVQDIIIRSISCHGIGGASRGLPPETNERVTVLLPDGEAIAGVVRWVCGQSFGMEMDREIDPRALMAAVQRQRELEGATESWVVSRLHRVPQPPERTNYRQI